MRPLLASFLMILLLAWNPLAQASTQPATALDLAALFMQNQGQIDSDSITELLTGGITSNLRVPPEHLGVAFWNQQTGARLDRQEIRELMGPVRQEGAFQLLEMAISLGGDRLPFDQEQLELLMEASFLASMRRPPQHIDIEYYDRRQGPEGQGGGVSGRVPEQTTGSRPQPKEAQPPASSREPKNLPDSEETLVKQLAALGFRLEPKDDLTLFPLLVWAQDANELEGLLKQDLTELHDLGLSYVQLADEPRIERQGDWMLLYAVAHFQINPQLNEEDRTQVNRIHRRLSQTLR